MFPTDSTLQYHKSNTLALSKSLNWTLPAQRCVFSTCDGTDAHTPAAELDVHSPRGSAFATKLHSFREAAHLLSVQIRVISRIVVTPGCAARKSAPTFGAKNLKSPAAPRTATTRRPPRGARPLHLTRRWRRRRPRRSQRLHLRRQAPLPRPRRCADRVGKVTFFFAFHGKVPLHRLFLTWTKR